MPVTTTAAAPVRDRDAVLLRRFARSRSPKLRDQLVERYLPLARHSAGKYAYGPEPFDDLLQVASVGLIKALDRYDPARGTTFSSYAIPTMIGELRRHFRDRGWSVRPPRELQERALAVERAEMELLGELGRSPSIDDIAHRTRLSAEAVLEARQALQGRHGISLSMPLSEDEEAETLGDRLGGPDEDFEAAECRVLVGRLARALTPREHTIVRLRFVEDLTQAEIGARVGLSQMHVSRVLRGALEKLRDEAAQRDDPYPDDQRD